MRFNAIYLPAYGPFTGAFLDLNEGRGRLEVVYGPNEAGKSSLLRAVSDFLFGIPGQTCDNFLHPYASLRIRACMERGGECLECVRRKANSKSLRGADDEEPVAEEVFRSFVPIDSREIFQTMFGLDAGRLRQGGDELVKGQSEFGQLLFSAAAGIEGLHSILKDLNEEAEKLFKPKASTTVVAKILERLKESKDRLREAQVSLTDWNKLQEDYENVLEECSRLDSEILEKRRRAERCKRIQMSLGLLRKRSEVLERLGTAGEEVRILREGFAADRQKAASDLVMKTGEVREYARRVGELRKEVEAIVLPEDLLAREQEILELHQETGAQRKASGDRHRLETELRQAESEAVRMLLGLGEPPDLDRVPRLVARAADKRQVQELSAMRASLDTEARDGQESLDREKQKLESARQQLGGLPGAKPVAGVRAAVKEALMAAAAEAKARNLQKSAAEESQRIGADTIALPWLSTLEALANCDLPAERLVAEWTSRLDKAEQAVEQARERVRAAQGEVSRFENTLAILEAGRSVPALTQLAQDRQHRNLGWKAVRRAWLESDNDSAEARDFLPQPADNLSLAKAYEESVAKSDDTADRLRVEADQVAKLEQARAAIEGARKELAARESELKDAGVKWREQVGEWEQLWMPFQVPASAPRQMAAWLERRVMILSRRDAVEEKNAQAGDLLEETERVKQQLRQCLIEMGEAAAPASDSLMGWRSLAEQVADAQEGLARRREKLTDQIGESERALAAAEVHLNRANAGLKNWNLKWAAMMAGLSLPVETEPSAAQEIIGVREELQVQSRVATDRKTRMAGIDRDEERFQGQLHRLLELVAADLAKAPEFDAVAELHKRLSQAKRQRDLRGTKTEDLEREQKALEKVERGQKLAESRLAALAAEAKCENPEELPALIEKSATRKELENKLREIEEQLETISGGQSVAELQAEAQGVEPDQIPGELESIGRDLEACGSRQKSADEKRVTLSNELKRMEDASDTCTASANIEACKAGALEAAEEYIRLQLARVVLQGAVDRYREKAEGDMLKRSSELFSLLTDGSFSGLKLDWDETGKAALVGVRTHTGEHVSLDGMSDGTRDQLYLALRLASMELYSRDHEAIPFIADDILVNFDDTRAEAAIRALVELAKHTQVLLFTHHKHLVELAKGGLQPSQLTISEIAGQAGALRMVSGGG